jgi:4-amino-4-deoxy-L-arabinose transferase-like glycosyltransferase
MPLSLRIRLNIDTAVLLALVVLYLLTTLPALGNDPLAGGDEGWIISASAKLADEGTFGSDLFEGFYGSEERYYFNLPLHHLALAGWFKVAGVSMASARLVSVVYGLAALLLTWALGRRLGGRWVGLGAAALLVLLRLNLTPFTGLTLTDLGATVRYDLVTVPYGLGAALLLLKRRDAVVSPDEMPSDGVPSPKKCLRASSAHEPPVSHVVVAGALLGLAALTQFIGAMFGPPLAAYLLTLRGVEWPRRVVLAGVLTVTAIAPFLPYAAYIAQAPDDFRGQARAVEQSTNFLSPGFYVEQLKREPSRFRDAVALERFPSSPGDLVRRPSARLALLVLAPLAGVSLLRRGYLTPTPLHGDGEGSSALRSESAFARGDVTRLVAIVLLALVVQLALFESTKRFVYWVVVVPFVCIVIADLGRAMWAWADERLGVTLRRRWLPRAVMLAVVAVGGLFAAEGLAVAAKDVGDARDAGDYEALGRRLEAVVPAGAVTMGDNRLWPAMRDRPYRSLHLLFYETNPRISRDQATDIPGAFDRTRVDYLLLSPLSRDQLKLLSPRDAEAFRQYLDTRMELTTTVEDRVYGPIDVYKLKDSRAP